MMKMRVAVMLAVAVLVGVWLYSVFIPPPPKICGTPGGPPVKGPRITLRDGRHLAYQEYGVPKERAKYKIIYVHGYGTNKYDDFPATPGLFEDIEAYIVAFDREGYGESDPHPERTIETTVLDIEELADQLGLGPKFHVIGYSCGGAVTWGTLKYIPHRLVGVIMMAPAINYWWPGLPNDLVQHEIKPNDPWNHWNLFITHYAPGLLYWWNTQNTRALLPPSKANNNSESLNDFSNLDPEQESQAYSTQQGIYESYLREIMIIFGEWAFDPLDLENPIPEIDGAVQLFQGGNDESVSVVLQRYIVQRLPWIQYHEVPNVGHRFALENNIKYEIIMSLVKNKTITTSFVESSY